MEDVEKHLLELIPNTENRTDVLKFFWRSVCVANETKANAWGVRWKNGPVLKIGDVDVLKIKSDEVFVMGNSGRKPPALKDTKELKWGPHPRSFYEINQEKSTQGGFDYSFPPHRSNTLLPHIKRKHISWVKECCRNSVAQPGNFPEVVEAIARLLGVPTVTPTGSKTGTDLPPDIVTSNEVPMNKIEADFHERMVGTYWTSGRCTGYWPSYFLRDVRDKGGVKVAKSLLNDTAESDGFERLAKENRIDLSMEALILTPPFPQLFNEHEIQVATERLKKWNFDFRLIQGQKPYHSLLIFRNQLQGAQKILEELIPELETRRICLDIFARSIVHAHELSPDRWGVTLFADCLRLNVGRIEVLALFADKMHLVLHADNYHGELDNIEGVDTRSDGRTEYQSVKGSFLRVFALSFATEYFSKVELSHSALLKKAAGTARHSMTASAHSPGVVLYLSEFLNRPLPQPSYVENAADWNKQTSFSKLPEEFVNPLHKEGQVVRIWVNAYERDEKARRKCIEYFGAVCGICAMNFAEEYGTEFEGFIHVHHLNPAHEGERETDPLRDLIPVCPNCHAVIHVGTDTPRTIKEVKEIRELAQAKRIQRHAR